VSQVFFAFKTKHGYLRTNETQLHCLSNLNHNYEAFECLDFESDSGCRDYFTNELTRHESLLVKIK
jgi:hypothetical protein